MDQGQNTNGIYTPPRPDFQSVRPVGDIVLTPGVEKKKSKLPWIVAGVVGALVVLVLVIVMIGSTGKGNSDVESAVLRYAAFLKLSPKQYEKIDKNNLEELRKILEEDSDATPFIDRVIEGSSQLDDEGLKKYTDDAKRYAEEIADKVGENANAEACARKLKELAEALPMYVSMNENLEALEGGSYDEAIKKVNNYGEYSGDDAIVYDLYLKAYTYAKSYIDNFYNNDNSKTEGLKRQLAQTRTAYSVAAGSIRDQMLNMLSCIYSNFAEHKE